MFGHLFGPDWERKRRNKDQTSLGGANLPKQDPEEVPKCTLKAQTVTGIGSQTMGSQANRKGKAKNQCKALPRKNKGKNKRVVPKGRNKIVALPKRESNKTVNVMYGYTPKMGFAIHDVVLHMEGHVPVAQIESISSDKIS